MIRETRVGKAKNSVQVLLRPVLGFRIEQRQIVLMIILRTRNHVSRYDKESYLLYDSESPALVKTSNMSLMIK